MANLLLWSEQFDNAVWAGGGLTITANTTAAPDTTVTADTADINDTGHAWSQPLSVTENTQYTFAFHAMRGTATGLKLSVYNNSAAAELVAPTSYYSSTNGSTFTRVSTTFTTPAGCTAISVYPLRDGGATGTVYLWGASFNLGATADAYVKTEGSTVTGLSTGTATETDTAQALSRRKIATVGRSNETDSALALTARKARSTGLATEADTAQARAIVKARAVGAATETDTALALSIASGLDVGVAAETDTAQALALVKVAAAARASETDSASALSLARLRATGSASETDTAAALAFLKRLAAGFAPEIDTALAPLLQGPLAIGLAQETDTAVALEFARQRTTGVPPRRKSPIWVRLRVDDEEVTATPQTVDDAVDRLVKRAVRTGAVSPPAITVDGPVSRDAKREIRAAFRAEFNRNAGVIAARAKLRQQQEQEDEEILLWLT